VGASLASHWQLDICDIADNVGGREYQTRAAFGIMSPNVWYHLVISIHYMPSGLATIYTYLNGQVYTTVSNVWYPPGVQRQNLFIGRSGWNDDYLTVEIDAFNVYNTSLTTPQVAALYATAFQVPSPTVAQWTDPSNYGATYFQSPIFSIPNLALQSTTTVDASEEQERESSELLRKKRQEGSSSRCRALLARASRTQHSTAQPDLTSRPQPLQSLQPVQPTTTVCAATTANHYSRVLPRQRAPALPPQPRDGSKLVQR
jgi:hypothetical protein